MAEQADPPLVEAPAKSLLQCRPGELFEQERNGSARGCDYQLGNMDMAFGLIPQS